MDQIEATSNERLPYLPPSVQVLPVNLSALSTGDSVDNGIPS